MCLPKTDTQTSGEQQPGKPLPSWWGQRQVQANYNFRST